MTSLPSLAAPSARAVPVLLIALVANAVGHTFLLIVLPGLGRHLGFSDVATGLIVGLPALALSLSGPLWGMAADHRGRRPVVLASLAAAALLTAALAAVLFLRAEGIIPVAAAIAAALGVRLTQGALGGGLMPGAQAYLADVTPPERRAGAMGAMGAAFGLGSIGGAALAWQAGAGLAVMALGGIAATIAAAAVAVLLLVPEPARPSRPAGVVDAAAGVAFAGLPRRLWRHLAITVCGLLAYGLLQQVTALRLEDVFGLETDAAVRRAGAIMMLTLAVMVTMQAGGVRALRWPPERLLRMGAAVAVGGVALAAVATDVLPFALATACVGAGLGLAVPGNLACLSLRAGPAMQARAAGINAIAQGLGLAAGPIVGATAHAVSPAAPYGAALLALGLVLLLAWAPRRSPADAPSFGE